MPKKSYYVRIAVPDNLQKNQNRLSSFALFKIQNAKSGFMTRETFRTLDLNL